jgi:hypothetical protein
MESASLPTHTAPAHTVGLSDDDWLRNRGLRIADQSGLADTDGRNHGRLQPLEGAAARRDAATTEASFR